MVWVLVAILAIALVAAAVVLVRQRRSQQLREGFGPEYDRTIAETGDRRAAERDLAERRERRSELEIRELDPDARDRYAERWRADTAHVRRPAGRRGGRGRRPRRRGDARARLSGRGDFDRRAAAVSVDHPVVVENYRAAHAISIRAVRDERAPRTCARPSSISARCSRSCSATTSRPSATRRSPGGPPMTAQRTTLTTRDLASPRGPRRERATARGGRRDAGPRRRGGGGRDLADERHAAGAIADAPTPGRCCPRARAASCSALGGDPGRSSSTTRATRSRMPTRSWRARCSSSPTASPAPASDLEGQWSRGEDVSTEDLRVALQRYRSFFRRLLAA